MAKRSISTEPFLWALFGARGLLAALLVPILLLFGVLYPLGWVGAPTRPVPLGRPVPLQPCTMGCSSRGTAS